MGTKIRKSLYGWCMDQVQQYGVKDKSPSQHILVPGAAVGRLAWDLATAGHSVEANDSSLLMAAATNRLWNQRNPINDKDFANDASIPIEVHPFALDYFTNEMDSHDRFRRVTIPSTTALSCPSHHLSYTVGDFVQIYQNPSGPTYDAIITCFFLDTASNIYQYLSILVDNLVVGGRWIHVGPLQWHRNAQLHPAANELREMIEYWFDIVHWSHDETAMEYRLDDDDDDNGDDDDDDGIAAAGNEKQKKPHRRSTKIDGFRPLRIVAIKK